MAWRVLGIVLAMAALAPGGVDLRGVVTDEKGQPVARARVGLREITASRFGRPGLHWQYLEIGERVVTDEAGKFVFTGVDAEKRYTLLVVAEGHGPQKFEGKDPAHVAEVKLKAGEELRKDPAHLVRGKVVGPDGKALAGVLVEPFGMSKGKDRFFAQPSSLDGVDPGTITNEKGEFAIFTKNAEARIDLRMYAKGFATGRFQLQPTGEQVQEYPLELGSGISGRIVREGKPVAGFTVCAAPASAKQVQDDTGALVLTTTDQDGRFAFGELGAEQRFGVYGVMSRCGEKGALSEQQLSSGPVGQMTDAGDLEAAPGFVVAGKLRFSDGGKVPNRTRIALRRHRLLSDVQSVAVDTDGAFKFVGVPAELVKLEIFVEGYRLSPLNESFEPLNGELLGLVNDDVLRLDVLMETGNFQQIKGLREQQAAGARYAKLKAEPLRGVAKDDAGGEK